MQGRVFRPVGIGADWGGLSPQEKNTTCEMRHTERPPSSDILALYRIEPLWGISA
jgi:hypothetical protein